MKSTFLALLSVLNGKHPKLNLVYSPIFINTEIRHEVKKWNINNGCVSYNTFSSISCPYKMNMQVSLHVHANDMPDCDSANLCCLGVLPHHR